MGLKRLPSLFEDEHRDIEKVTVEHARQAQELYGEIGRLTTQRAW